MFILEGFRELILVATNVCLGGHAHGQNGIVFLANSVLDNVHFVAEKQINP